MSRYSNYNLVYRLQKWMDTVAGQTFLNYAYSWGASIVILGALFKLTHLPGANVMLFIGMGTEVFVFFISAFDRPFDKTAEGREMPTRLTEEFLEKGMVEYPNAKAEAPAASAVSSAEVEPSVEKVNVETAEPTVNVSSSTASAAPQQPAYVPQMSQEEAEAMNEAQGCYVEELKTLVETLKKVNEQSTRLTRDSEEMENLNRTLIGINKVYDLHFASISRQVTTIEDINEQTRQLAAKIEEVNNIYARMMQQLSVMTNPMGHSAAPAANEQA